MANNSQFSDLNKLMTIILDPVYQFNKDELIWPRKAELKLIYYKDKKTIPISKESSYGAFLTVSDQKNSFIQNGLVQFIETEHFNKRIRVFVKKKLQNEEFVASFGVFQIDLDDRIIYTHKISAADPFTFCVFPKLLKKEDLDSIDKQTREKITFNFNYFFGIQEAKFNEFIAFSYLKAAKTFFEKNEENVLKISQKIESTAKAQEILNKITSIIEDASKRKNIFFKKYGLSEIWKSAARIMVSVRFKKILEMCYEKLGKKFEFDVEGENKFLLISGIRVLVINMLNSKVSLDDSNLKNDELDLHNYDLLMILHPRAIPSYFGNQKLLIVQSNGFAFEQMHYTYNVNYGGFKVWEELAKFTLFAFKIID